MLIILFGQAGSGKNYVGSILVKHFNYHYWDADEALPTQMRAFIEAKKPFTDEMREAFTKIMIEKISEHHKSHTNLVISQALYREKNRKEVLEIFPDALFIYIQADPAAILERIKNRQDWINEEFAEIMLKNFEAPLMAHEVLINNGNETAIIKQLKIILANAKTP